MTTRGDATRAKLTEATRQVVTEVGYSQATTKAIARAAGVAEGTIYRHFPNKYALFAAAALESHQHVMGELDALPASAGQGSLTQNLIAALEGLASLRDAVLPLELALIAEPDPERGAAVQAHLTEGAALPGPPGALAAYLEAEQSAGRIRGDLNCKMAAMTLMASLMGLALMPVPQSTAAEQQSFIASLVELFVRGAAQ